VGRIGERPDRALRQARKSPIVGSVQSVNEIAQAKTGSTRMPCMVTACIGFSAPRLKYAVCGSPRNTSVIPRAIMMAPMAIAERRDGLDELHHGSDAATDAVR
jgi:hypothetical protein